MAGGGIGSGPGECGGGGGGGGGGGTTGGGGTGDGYTKWWHLQDDGYVYLHLFTHLYKAHLGHRFIPTLDFFFFLCVLVSL